MIADRRACALIIALACAARSLAEVPPLVVRVEKTDGTAVSGTLAAVSATEATLVGGPTLAIAGVRRIVADVADARGPVSVECTDGGTLSGDDFTWEDGPAVLTRPGGRAELPVERVRSVTLRPSRAGTEAERADWRAALPEQPQTDLVVVGRQTEAGERLDVVECAIVAVTPDAVVVMLDDDRIPVKRAKVVGLWFLRAAAAAGGTRVEVVGGGLVARSVAWTPEALVLDAAVRLPAAGLRAIDYAAGRTVRLETLRPERSVAEPFFGELGQVDGLAVAFAPRFVADDGGQALVLRPRSHVVWRVPADARRFRAAVAAEPGRQPGGQVVTLRLDDKELFRRRLEDGGSIPVDLDVASGRRLAIQVEFPVGGGMGCPIRLTDPVFEQ